MNRADFCNTNTNIFNSKIKTEYEYKYIQFENIKQIRILIYSIAMTKIFKYISDADNDDDEDNSYVGGRGVKECVH